ncbi:MAG: TetR/AcrR family transcriptional regulator [Alphaproteobacteria bacterium]|nr:TetR/AcrR family transcriptional regulator [Alphaproteobacteria bacterium]
MKNKSSRPRGRPRTFDRDEVLDHAITTFLAKGYRGASLDDLTKSMGINRPSLYATFGNKQRLFMEAIDRYAETFGSEPMKALYGEEDIENAIAAFFETKIRYFTLRGKPRGCLISNIATEAAENDGQVRDKLTGMFAENEKIIADRLRVAQDLGQLPKYSDPLAFARMIVSIALSIATRARVGDSREELSRTVGDFMAVLFPKPT